MLDDELGTWDWNTSAMLHLCPLLRWTLITMCFWSASILLRLALFACSVCWPVRLIDRSRRNFAFFSRLQGCTSSAPILRWTSITMCLSMWIRYVCFACFVCLLNDYCTSYAVLEKNSLYEERGTSALVSVNNVETYPPGSGTSQSWIRPVIWARTQMDYIWLAHNLPTHICILNNETLNDYSSF